MQYTMLHFILQEGLLSATQDDAMDLYLGLGILRYSLGGFRVRV